MAKHDTATGATIGYVLKVFPRISETFVINEMLAMESFGEKLCVLALHRPPAPVRHATLRELRAPVSYADDVEIEEVDIGRARRRLAKHFAIAPTDMQRFLPRKYVRLALALAKLASERDVGHLHAHFASRSGHVAALAAVLLECPYSITAHAKDIYHDEVDPDVLRWKIRHAKFVATVTEYNRSHLERLVASIPGAQDKVVRVYNGVNLARFAPTPARETATPLLLGIGRLVEKKGFEHLIAACGLLVERGRRFRCEIIGGGERTEQLGESIARLGLADVVELQGVLPTEKVMGRLRDAFVLVLPCIVGEDGNVDALPTVIIEAMATARAVVSTRLSGIPEMVVNGETGLLVEPADAAALAGAIAALLDEPERAHAMGRAGRRRAEELFDLFVNARVIRDLIRGRFAVAKAV
jgi:glycosyltransferase involved in cell wall biosynthesis